MVDLWTPCLYIFLVHDTSRTVGRCVGYSALVVTVGTCHADTADSTGLETVVAIVVPQPVLHSLASLLGSYIYREVRRCKHAVVHCLEPFVISLHPAEIVVRAVLVSKER